MLHILLMAIKLDSKDYQILKILDEDFRTPFSKIAKKVQLSKNSVALRFDKLKEVTLHNLVGINNSLLGYTLIKVFYSFDFYDQALQEHIKKEFNNLSSCIWVAKIYGQYDVCIAFLVKEIHDFIEQDSQFNKIFASKINQKDIQIIHQEYYFRHNYLHQNPIIRTYKVTRNNQVYPLTHNEKNLILAFRYQPRTSLIELAKKTNMTTKTVAAKIKQLEKAGVITGYFMTLDPLQFGYQTYKLLLQMHNIPDVEAFEQYLRSSKKCPLHL